MHKILTLKSQKIRVNINLLGNKQRWREADEPCQDGNVAAISHNLSGVAFFILELPSRHAELVSASQG